MRIALVLTIISLSGATARTQSGEKPTLDAKLILVPVVVRNHDGLVVSNLGKEDFQLFDNGKRQNIVSLSVENAESQVAPVGSPPDTTTAGAPSTGAIGLEVPERLIVYLFDDVTIRDPGDLKSIRDAVAQQIGALPPRGRAAVFTTSCRVLQDFTNDRAKLQDAVTRLQLKPFPSCRVSQAQTLQVEVLNRVISAISHLPMRREIILVSSGFYVGHGPSKAEMDLIDTAVRSNVVIHSVDVGNQPESDSPYGARPEFQTNSLVLEELAHGTGGTYEKRKDFAASFRRLATPDSHYVLGFVPTGTPDGRFHQLRIKVDKSGKLKVDARNGYYAP